MFLLAMTVRFSLLQHLLAQTCCVYLQHLPGIHACDGVVVEPLFIAGPICEQVVVVDRRHCIPRKAFISPLEEEDWVSPCAVQFQNDCAAWRL